MPIINLGSRSADGVVSLGYVGEYTGATQYPYTVPYGDVDRLSLCYGQKFTAGEKFRIVSGPTVGTLDSARAEAEGGWGNDINDYYTAPGGYTGEVTISLERIGTDEVVGAWLVTMVVEDGVVIGVSFRRPITQPLKQSIKRSLSA